MKSYTWAQLIQLSVGSIGLLATVGGLIYVGVYKIPITFGMLVLASVLASLFGFTIRVSAADEAALEEYKKKFQEYAKILEENASDYKKLKETSDSQVSEIEKLQKRIEGLKAERDGAKKASSPPKMEDESAAASPPKKASSSPKMEDESRTDPRAPQVPRKKAPVAAA